ncbi:short chain dehydrogenase [Xylariaceae sp. FL1272]|nr:short chain dehydrogenase [Xylariaceae sp. FL1272]
MTSLQISSLFGVQGRVALVTGGSSGLGFMICKGLVSNGAKVYLVALPSDPIAQKVDELNEIGKQSSGSAEGFPCDLSSKDAIGELAKTISQKEAHLDVLVSNAGVRRDPPIACDVLKAPLEELQVSMWSSKAQDWEQTFRINTTAHYYLAVAFSPLLAAASQLDLGKEKLGRSEGRGAVIITSSCASMHNATNIDLTSYATSKAATDHLVKLLAAKFSRFYIRVMSINPGFVPSNMNPIGAEGNIFSNLFDQVPAKRAGNEEDIAGAVLYLSSKAGSYINGISLCVDGGRVLVANGQE